MVTKDLIQTVIEFAEKEVYKFTYPIFIKSSNGKPDLLASSIVISYERKYFLITASHVLLEVLKSGSSPIMGVNGRYVQITEEFVYSENDRKDHFDIAFCELPSNLVNENKITSLDEKHLLLEVPDINHLALINGYPNSKNKQSKAFFGRDNFRARSYSYAGNLQKEFLNWGKCQKKRGVHTCMSYRKTERGNTPVHPKGISGGGLWVVPDIRHKESYFLDSIAIEYHEKENVVFGTKISEVIKMIKYT